MVAVKTCSQPVAMTAATHLPHPARLARGLHLLELVIALMVLSVLLALAWVLAQGDYLIPIPGTKQRRYLEENVAALQIRLSAAELASLEGIFSPQATAGPRYTEEVMALLNR